MTRFILANQTAGARRRVYFDCRDATDGITPETGEAGGQPQVSTDGGAWTDTGIGTLTAIGQGRYYAELTNAAVATAGRVIETRYKSANTAETPGDSVQVVGFDPDDADGLGLARLDAAVTSRSSHAAADVWAVATRQLTAVQAFDLTGNITGNIAGNIAGNITGNLSGSVGSVAGHTPQSGDSFARIGANGLGLTQVSLAADLRLKKNAAFANFQFLMVDGTDYVTPKTGLSVSGQRAIDGGGFAALANGVGEVGNGLYRVNLAASDLNGDMVTLRFSASGAADTFVSIITQTE